MRRFLQRRLVDGVFFAVVMILLGGLAQVLHIDPAHPSDSAHLILQARAWLSGHLDIGAHIHDSIIVNDKVYIIYPPLPAALMVPFVALLGKGFSDVWFTWAFGALNIILLFRTFEVMRVRRLIARVPFENLIIALTFGFGTIALWICLGGKVWFTIQTISIFGIMLTLHSTFSRRWPLAMLGVGMVLLTRTSEALIGIVPLVVYLHDSGVGLRGQGLRGWLPQRWPSWHELIVTLTPFIIAVLILLVRNKIYFDNFLSTGFEIQNQQNYPQIKYGVLSWHYIWSNFVIDFLRGPGFYFSGPNGVDVKVDLYAGGLGTNMFVSTPLLAIFLFAPQGKSPQPWLRWTFWITVALMLLSILSFCAAGARQVGARYVLPLYPLLFLLLAQRAAPLDTRWISLAGLGVFINLLLAWTFWLARPLTMKFTASSAGLVLLACIVALVLLGRQRMRQKEQEQIELLDSTDDAVDSKASKEVIIA